MYAIARIAGMQFRIEPDLDVKVPRLSAAEGSSYEISEILLAVDDGTVQIGQPTLKGVKASAKIISHERAPKIIVFRKKRRKGFEVRKGHRQRYTLLHVEKIQGLTAKPKAEAKPEAATKPKATAKPKAEAKPKAAAKPKTVAKPKAAVKSKASTKPKAAAKPKAPAKPKAEAKKKTSRSKKASGE
jgi:large subunit ribosomal protein L21